MSRIAAIDIGTNTVLLLVAEVDSKSQIVPLVQKEIVVRLGKGVDRTGNLDAEAIGRAIQALRGYKQTAHEHGVSAILASATSAVRDANNRDDFLRRVQTDLNMDVRVLTGEEEARLTYRGALSNRKPLQGKLAVIDIGGGSTEFILGNQHHIDQAVSLNFGSVRLTERFIKHDPITADEYNLVQQTIRQQLNQLRREDFAGRALIGVAGTVTTLAAMQKKMKNYRPELVDGTELSLADISEIVKNLQVTTLAERKRLPGLQPERADVILAGALILQEAMRRFGQIRVLVSDRGLRFGLVVDYLDPVL